MDIQKIIEMSDEKRRNVIIRRRIRRRPKRIERQRFSEKEMLNLLKESLCRSWRKWESQRKPEHPSVYDYRKTFGSWGQAVKKAYGDIDTGGKRDGAYYIKLVIEFDLWKHSQYVIAHKLRPDIVPSYRQLRKGWKSYRVLVEAAKRVSIKKILERYMSLYRRLGRKPTMDQCRQDGVQIDYAIRLLGSRERLDELINMVENHAKS